jgi:hypothetical protein
MGNKYHVLHRHLSRLSRLSRRDDLELGVAVTSIHRAAEKGYSRKPIFSRSHPYPIRPAQSPYRAGPVIFAGLAHSLPRANQPIG